MRFMPGNGRLMGAHHASLRKLRGSAMLITAVLLAVCWAGIARGGINPALVGGARHSVALKGDGTVLAWGDNLSGQLGDGTAIQRITPVTVPGLSGITAIAAGSFHSLALKSDGTVVAWGLNSKGQLGDSSNVQRNAPVAVTGLTSVKSLAAGSYHSVALKSDGTVWCWGNNDYGQLGDETTTSWNESVQTGGLSTVTAVAAGGTHTLALKSDGTVWAWGGNDFGQIGDGTMTRRPIPVQVPGLTGVIAIAAGFYHSVALKSDGTVWAWGYNSSGQLGDSSTTTRYSPVTATGLVNVTAVAAGVNHTVAMRNDGTVWTWGRNDKGQLGNRTTLQKLVPVQAYNVSEAIIIAAGEQHTMAVRADGAVMTWGSNDAGQLGIGLVNRQLTPLVVAGLSGGKAIVAGCYFGGALKTDSTAVTWGNNDYGQLGDGRNVGHGTPQPVLDLTTVKDISSGYRHGAVVKDDGTVWTWGYNYFGQLGDGTTAQRNTPVTVPGLTGMTAVAAGNTHTLALNSDGSLSAWGGNDKGQLGNSSTTQSAAPVTVSTLSGATAVAAGNYHSVALKGDGTVWCWGRNDSGQVGDGTTIQRLTAVQASVVSDIIAIAAGDNHTVALKRDGTVWTWGGNARGQLGNGTIVQNSTPAQVPDLTNVIAITAGDYHTAALKSDGTVWSWGANDYGQLGDGTTTQRLTPVQIGISSVTALAGGYDHTLAVKDDGTVWAWGDNARGQLGYGNPGTPVEIAGLNMDTFGFSGTVSINGGADATAATAVSLTLSCSARKGCAKMQFSNDKSVWSALEPIAASKSWTVPTGDGLKTVFVRFSDTAGNLSGSYNDTIQLDTSGPTGVVSINGGSAFTGSSLVSLTLSCSDPNGCDQMQLSNDRVVWNTVESFNATRDWVLVNGDGTKTVSARFRDTLGNWSSAISGTIYLDTTGPTGSVVINDDNALTNTTAVTLTLTCSDPSGCAQVRFSHDGIAWSVPETYASVKAWTLLSGDGAKSVQVRYADGAGNWSAPCSDSIILDTVAPLGSITINADGAKTTDTAVTLALTCSDLHGCSRMQLSNNGVDWLASEDFAAARSWRLTSRDGVKAVYTRFQDGAGNWSVPASDTIELALPPRVTMFPPPRRYTTAQTVTLRTTSPTAVIHYTLDGSLPTASSLIYTAPLAISATTTISCCAIDGAGTMGPVLIDTYTIDPARKWVNVVTSGDHTLALKSDGTMWAWGNNDAGQLGDGTTLPHSPLRVGDGNQWVALAAGAEHSLALKADGTLWAWGNAANGRLGTGDSSGYRVTPIQIGADNSWVAVAAGSFHSVGLKGDGTLWAWGANVDGQLGDHTLAQRILPVQIASDSIWTAIATGERHTLAISMDRTLWTWGYNGTGQLGDGTVELRNAPVLVGQSSGWVSMAGGGGHSLAIRSDGSLWGWGDNISGQVGDGSATRRLAPVIVASGSVWREVAAGNGHSVAIRSDGTFWSWGNNSNGQLGDGSTITWTAPVLMGGASDWSEVTVGGNSTLARKITGTLWGCGANSVGQLGDSTVIDRSPPVQVANIPVVTVALAGGTTYALTPAITIALTAANDDDVASMQFSDDQANWSALEPYGPEKNWTLSGGDGEKLVQVRLLNGLGVVLGQYTGSIVLDTLPPVGSLIVNNGSLVSRSATLTMVSNVSDATSGVADMQFAEDPDFTEASWLPFAQTTTWTLSPANGTKNIFSRYRDKSGNVSATGTATILLDDVPPGFTIDPPRTTNSTSFTVTGTKEVGVTVTVATPPEVTAQLTAPAEAAVWSCQLDGLSVGGSNVIFTAVDAAGNTVTQPLVVTYDPAWLSLSLTIAGTEGSSTIIPMTRKTAISLLITADSADAPNAMRFMKSNGSWGKWETFRNTRSWKLSSTNGNQTVSMQVRYASGQVSQTVSAQIMLDSKAPKGTFVINQNSKSTSSATVTLSLSASDATSGVEGMQVSENSKFVNAAWEAYADSKQFTLSATKGTKKVYVRFRDLAGNVSSSIKKSIVLNIVPNIAEMSRAVVINDAASPAAVLSGDSAAGTDDIPAAINQILDAWRTAYNAGLAVPDQLARVNALLPLYHQGFLHDGMTAAQSLMDFFGRNPGVVSELQVAKILVPVENDHVTVVLQGITALNGTYYSAPLTFRYAESQDKQLKWLVYGNQKPVVSSLSAGRTLTYAADGTTVFSDSLAVAAVVPAGNYMTGTVSGPNPGDVPRSLLKGATRDGRERFSSADGGMLPESTPAPATGEVYTVMLTGADPADTISYREIVYGTTGQTITLTAPTSHQLSEARLGNPLTVTWSMPAAPFVVKGIRVFGWVTDASGGTVTVEKTEVLTATTTAITLPLPGSGQTAIGAGVGVEVVGVGNECTTVRWEFGN